MTETTNDSMKMAVHVMARLWNVYHRNVIIPTTNGRRVSNAQRDVVSLELHRFYGEVRALLQSSETAPAAPMIEVVR